MNYCRPPLLAILLAGTALVIPPMRPAPAQAQSAPEAYALSIPAQPMPQALAALSARTGVQVFYTGDAAYGLTSRALNGSYSLDQALAQMLAGTGASARRVGENGITISVVGETAPGIGSLDPEGAVMLGTIVLSGGATGDMYSTPGPVSHVSEEELSQVPGTSMGDMFRTTPGVTATASRSGQGLNMNIRGLQGMNRVATLIDGTQQATSGYRGYRGHYSGTYVDPDLIAGIDITKGPDGGAHGNGAMGGVVNMRTIRAEDIIAPGKDRGFVLKFGASSNSVSRPATGTNVQRSEASSGFNGASFNGSIAGAFRFGDWDLMLAQTRRQSGNYFAGSNGGTMQAGNGGALSPIAPGAEVPNTSQSMHSTLFKLGYNPGADTRIEFTASRLRGKMAEADEFAYVYNFARPSEQALSPTATDMLKLSISHNPADNPYLNLEASIWATEVELTRNGAPLNWTKTKTIGLELQNRSEFHLGGTAVRLSYGIQASREKADGVDYAFVYPWGTFLETAGPNGTRDLVSLFSRAEFDVTERFGVIAGLRYDHYSLKQGDSPWLVGYDIPSQTRLNPSLTLTYQLADGVQIYGQYTEGWRPPALRETSYRLGEILAPNPSLRPETARNIELGTNITRSGVFTEDDSLFIKASWFSNAYKDYIARLPLNPLRPSEPYFWGNMDSAKFEGVDLALRYDRPRFFASGALTYYTKTEYCYGPWGCSESGIGTDYGGNSIPPKLHVTATLGGRFLDEKLTLGTRLTHFSGRATETQIGGYVTPTLWPSRTIVDLFGSYDVNETTSMSFSIDNVTDRYYLDPLAVTRAPAPGRTARIGLTMKF